ncbi:hypothetical protein ACHIPZ_17900 [Antrihabitans sp. NCIMB 15449]|uniref:Uncharacterized protein n=1 Tax=Antrihabitans spumae TaxID=3373370 RepID=A0ABW7JQP5_9NOCA
MADERTSAKATPERKKDRDDHTDPPGPVDHGGRGGMATREQDSDEPER